uniref:Uncharacterized protein n=1 Tax=Anguilla anguilla TaxID=7936 RepID=A0A0E9TQ42_ANGAN
MMKRGGGNPCGDYPMNLSLTSL